MSARKSAETGAVDKPVGDTMAVEEFLATLEHPLESTVEAIRTAILGVDPRISEGLQDKAPSFHFHGWFATTDVHRKDSVAVVFHAPAQGAARRKAGVRIDDSAQLLKWPSEERAVVRFKDLEDFMTKRAAFKSVVTQWIEQMPS